MISYLADKYNRLITILSLKASGFWFARAVVCLLPRPSPFHRRRLERRLAVFDIDLELDGATAVLGDQRVAVLAQLAGELVERQRFERFAHRDRAEGTS